MHAKHLVTAFVVALISTPLSAQSVKAGIAAWQKADYASAVAIWTPLAKRGDPDAEFNLGQAYRLGRGVSLDLATAKNWFEKAARAGHLDAETTLGLLLFQNGDHDAGLKWLRQAADRGEPRALLVYGTALYNGDGVTQDRLLGYAYVSRAARTGLAPARDTLSQLDSLMPEPERRKALLLASAQPKSRPTPSKPLPASRRAQTPPSAISTARPVQRSPKADDREALAPAAGGSWRIQLGAFSHRSTAEAQYRRLSSKPALSGRNATYVPVGSMTRLQIGPFESKAAAMRACSLLGTACFATPGK